MLAVATDFSISLLYRKSFELIPPLLVFSFSDYVPNQVEIFL